MTIEMLVYKGDEELLREVVSMVTLSVVAQKGNVAIQLPVLPAGPEYHADPDAGPHHHFVFWGEQLLETSIQLTEDGVSFSYKEQIFHYPIANALELMAQPSYEDYKFTTPCVVVFVKAKE